MSVGLAVAATCAAAACVLAELIIRQTVVWRLDEAFAAAVPAWRTPMLTAIMQPATHIGDILVAGGITLAVGAAMLLSSRLRTSGFALLGAGAGSAVTIEMVKHLGQRARPSSQFAITNIPDPYSFPSGHSGATMLLACMLGYLALRHLRFPVSGVLAVLGFTLAVLVGVSRVYLGVHWPVDVIGGWLVAWAWSAAGIGLLRTQEAAAEATASTQPDATRGGTSA